MNPALLVIDMQRTFYEQKPVAFQTKLLPNVQAALSAARAASVPIVHVMTRYSQDKSDWPEAWVHSDRIWCLEGTEGVQILEEVEPLAGEPVVIKTRFSGFYETRLEAVIQDLGVDTLFIAGYSSDVCVRMTTMDAYNRGYSLFLLADCVHGDREETKTSIEYLVWLTNLKVISTEELSGLWDPKR